MNHRFTIVFDRESEIAIGFLGGKFERVPGRHSNLIQTALRSLLVNLSDRKPYLCFGFEDDGKPYHYGWNHCSNSNYPHMEWRDPTRTIRADVAGYSQTPLWGELMTRIDIARHGNIPPDADDGIWESPKRPRYKMNKLYSKPLPLP